MSPSCEATWATSLDGATSDTALATLDTELGTFDTLLETPETLETELVTFDTLLETPETLETPEAALGSLEAESATLETPLAAFSSALLSIDCAKFAEILASTSSLRSVVATPISQLGASCATFGSLCALS